ncbi:glycosyltransferase family 9 protein [Paraglaciecola sp.]|uniref:glycosyltransferase family 9 protein n=1 Tax=Paraglaciecola sp. TaxID=1920173 RepID=UPI00273D25BD|nr:hypothetical protein [Paraglaciecola sp.]MDP5032903.1 hypothetical protein [Paraglaciecola sp.]
MTKVAALSPQKILIIRMLSDSDVVAIGLPALRFFKQKFPEAEIHFLSFGQAAGVLKLAEPETDVKVLEYWPDDFFQAMEAFLGLAEDIIGEAYSQIVNLDTAFMPCFLARFLQDAGEPIGGNYLSISIQTLLDKVKDQSLQADYVNVPATYMLSSFFTMSRWFSNWTVGDYLPEGGYPEFYLKQCCGFGSITMDNRIDMNIQPGARNETKKATVALCLSQSDDGYIYPYSTDLALALQEAGCKVWFDRDSNFELSGLLRKLANSDLVVCKASAFKWYADAVACPTLLISGMANPKIVMPDFATDTTAPCPLHSGQVLTQNERLQARCLCEKPAVLADNIVSILQALNGAAEDE